MTAAGLVALPATDLTFHEIPAHICYVLDSRQ
jgi:hypothetical protein